MMSNGTRKVIVFSEERLAHDSEGIFHSESTATKGNAWHADVPEDFEPVFVARSRFEKDPKGEPLEGRAIALPYYVGLRQTIVRSFSVWRTIHRALDGASLAVVKAPGMIGFLASMSAEVRRVPLAVQVVGDASGVLESGILGKMPRVFSRLAAIMTTRAMKNAKAVRYVTRSELQKRYPAPESAFVHAFSDVVVPSHPVWRLSTSEDPRIVTVGSLDQLYKGHQFLISALPTIRKRVPAATLTIIGSGQHLSLLQNLAAEHGVSDAVFFAGFISDRQRLERMVGAATLFVLPSLTEGMPRALIEAMSLGTPAIASRVGGVPELLSDTAMFEAGDVDEMATLISRLLTHPDLLQQLSEAGLLTVRPYGVVESTQARLDWQRTLHDLVLNHEP